MCSRKRLTFIKDFINNESVCHFMVVQLFKLSTKDIRDGPFDIQGGGGLGFF